MIEPLAATELIGNVSPPPMILATKLYIPPVRPNQVYRPHLVARLNDALRREHKLILLSTSPGFGKTTLLSEWVADTNLAVSEPELRSSEQPTAQNPKVAWVSLDKDDNNPHRFLAYCVAALQTVKADVGQATLAMLQRFDVHLLTPKVLVTALINEATPITAPLIFVLDDYHVINNQLIHDSLTFLLANMPPHVYLVITSRTEPPLPLARLRSRGHLTELGTAELRFRPAEVVTFLKRTMGLNLSAAETAALDHRTEGWIAGLQMAAISMQGLPDTEDFVRAFTGSHRYILDYLLEEVLNRQPAPVQSFLLQTSILERFCAPLCDAIWDRNVLSGLPGQEGEGENQLPSLPVGHRGSTSSTTSLSHLPASAREILEYLEQANLFIMPLDDKRYWYRYHHLFAELLRHRLAQTDLAGTPVDIAALHRRASTWYEQKRFLVEAMSHALAAVDVERVVRLARQKAAAMLSRGELVTVLSWLDTLPAALDRSHPHLSLLQAWAMVLTGELQAVEAHLQAAEKGLKTGQFDLPAADRTDILGEVATLRAAVAYFQRDMPAAITLFHQALEHLSVNNLFLRGIIMQCLGAAHSWCGHVVEATRTFEEASVISQATGNRLVTLIAMWNLAQLYAEQGYLHQAADVYRQALALVDQQTEADRQSLLSFIGRLHIGLAEILYQWDQVEPARQHGLAGIRLGEQAQESSTLACGYLVLARLEQTRGGDDKVLEALQKARQFAQRYTGPRYLLAQVTIFQARLWLAQGNLRAVAGWVQEHSLQFNPLPDSIPYLQEGEYLVLVRLLLVQSQDQHDELALPVDAPLKVAIDLLARIIEAARAAGRTGRVIEALTLQALVFRARGNTAEALAALQEALLLAEPEGYIRLFVDEGSSLAELLGRAAAQNIAQNYVAKLLPLIHQASSPQSFSRSQSPLLLDPLSERELEILHLIATGMSNKELAEELVVTVGTVKWHLNNIYSKLAVRSRTQAVARARELSLLSG